MSGRLSTRLDTSNRAAWLACRTQQEIAEAVGVPRTTIEEILTKMADLPKPNKAGVEHATASIARPLPTQPEQRRVERETG